MFPEQRTYSEWRASTFAAGGVVFADGRFGGNKTAVLPNTVAVSTCQDCHMADIEQKPCDTGSTHPDVGGHFFPGANTWALGAVLDEYGAASGLTAPAVAAAAARTVAMLEAAADLEVTQVGYRLTVRVVNQTGHKLPTGYPEGRRMWLGLKVFAGASDVPIAEDGAYVADTATLDVAHTTKLYEVRHVIAPDVAALTGHAAGTPFHLVLNGAVAFDNRIPPRGFTAAAFDAFGGAPVGLPYADGQHWDDTTYTLPLAATRVEASLYYQTTSREYAEFLRDTAPDATGQNTLLIAGSPAAERARRDGPGDARAGAHLRPTTPRATTGTPARSTTSASPARAPGTRPCPDDGNVCTDDVCASLTGDAASSAAGSATTAIRVRRTTPAQAGRGGTTSGAAGARCLMTTLGGASVCAKPLPQGLRRFLDQRLPQGRRLLAKLERSASAVRQPASSIASEGPRSDLRRHARHARGRRAEQEGVTTDHVRVRRDRRTTRGARAGCARAPAVIVVRAVGSWRARSAGSSSRTCCTCRRRRAGRTAAASADPRHRSRERRPPARR
jgi:hypothetical protein